MDIHEQSIELYWVCTVQPYYNCEREEECFLHFFSGRVDAGLIDLNHERNEKLQWFDLQSVLHAGVENVPFNDNGDVLAGNGNLPYVTKLAYVKLFGNITDLYMKGKVVTR